MKRKIPPEAFGHYLAQGIERSYRATAERFGVSTTAIANLAGREHWSERVAAHERKASETATKKAAETLASARERHLKITRAIQVKALEGLRSMTLSSGWECVRSLDVAVKLERVLLGEPTERTAVEVEDVIKREYERWLTPAVDDSAAPEESPAPPDVMPTEPDAPEAGDEDATYPPTP